MGRQQPGAVTGNARVRQLGLFALQRLFGLGNTLLDRGILAGFLIRELLFAGRPRRAWRGRR